MKYRITIFKTLRGNKEFVDLGDQAYGEWIIYENDSPQYHVSCFRENSKSDEIIKGLIENDCWEIEGILLEIERLEGIKLHLGKRSSFEIEASSELRELDLPPLPSEWIENIESRIQK